MLSSRLQELFDEFLCKIKEQFDNVSLTGEMSANQNQIKKISNPSEYGYKQEEPGEIRVNQSKIKKDRSTNNYGCKQEDLGDMYAKQNKLRKVRNISPFDKQVELNLLDKQPSFMLRKNDFAADWFLPKHSHSSELRRKYQKSPKYDKNRTKKNLDDRIVTMQKKIEKRRRKEQFQPILTNVEPNIERIMCKAHKTEGAGFYDGKMKRCICKNADLYDNKAKARLSRNKQNFQVEGLGTHPFDYRSKDEPMDSFSNFTFESTYTSSN